MMRLSLFAVAAALVLSVTLTGAAGERGGKVPAVLNFKMPGLDGKEMDLSQYQGKVVLFVNVASKCGYTPQYEQLQALYAKYGKDGLVIVGVPSNQFGKQEPGSNDEIAEFCKKNYGVTFPMLAKVDVNGKNAAPLYRHLTGKDTNPKFAGAIKWNFEKFLVGRNGEVVARYASDADLQGEKFLTTLQAELNKK